MASNHFTKSFSVKPCVWLCMENRIFRNAFHLTLKIKALTRKSFYISIFPTNYFQTQTRRERERERERETTRRDHADRTRSHRSHQSCRSQHHADRTGLVNRNTAPIAPHRSSKDCTGFVNRSTASIAPR